MSADSAAPEAGTDLAVHQPAPPPALAGMSVMSDDELVRTFRISRALAASGMFKDVRSAEQAFAKILLGRDLGLTPTQALASLFLVEGRPVVAGVMLVKFIRDRAAEGYVGKFVEQTNEKATFRLTLPNGDVVEESFTMEDAKTAGLNTKDTYKKYPKNMLSWRAVANIVRFHAPEILQGVPVYVEGEIEAREALTEGEGSGAALTPGAQFSEPVEAVLARAAALGHVGLADRATAEMTLMGQPDQWVAQWVARATVELDEMEQAGGGAPAAPGQADGPIAEALAEADAAPEPEPEVVDAEPTGEDYAAALGAAAEDPFDVAESNLLDRLTAAQEAGDAAEVEEVEAELKALATERDARADEAQGNLL